MSITSRLLAGDEPRERLLRQGAGALSDAELVGLVAGIEGQGRDDVSMAHELIVAWPTPATACFALCLS
jgi:DNA repair protein RadC